MGTPKLTNFEVRRIRKASAYGMCHCVLARAWGVSVSSISRMCRGESYRDAGGPITRHSPGGMLRQLTNDAARRLRESAAEDTHKSYRELGKEWGIGGSTVRSICLGETYRDAGGPSVPPRTRSYGHKLTRVDAKHIREEAADGRAYAFLAEQWDVCYATIVQMCRGETYRDAEGPLAPYASQCQWSAQRKFDNAEVVHIRNAAAAGKSYRALAREWGATAPTISSLCTGQLYENAEGPLQKCGDRCYRRRRKGKKSKGGSAFFTNKKARAIRESYVPGTSDVGRLTLRYNCGKETIANLLHGTTYIEAGGPTFSRLYRPRRQ